MLRPPSSVGAVQPTVMLRAAGVPTTVGAPGAPGTSPAVRAASLDSESPVQLPPASAV